jgi:predicted lipid-binding transport protein (Tim44 family)
MGLIKSIFGAIFGLIGGIFKTIGGLVGLGKKSEFYMELNEADSSSLPATPSTSAPAAKAEAAPAQAKTAAPATAPKTAAPAPAPAAPAAPVPTAFASNYLTIVGTSQSSRRRPGPSLSPFRDMAKQVNGR